MNVSFYISRRLRLASRKGSRSSVAIRVGVAGVALSMAVLLATVAIVGGFKQGIISKLQGFEAQVSVLPPYDPATGRSAEIMDHADLVTEAVKRHWPSARTVEAFRHPAILKTDTDFEGVVMTARSDSWPADFEKSNVVEGCWPDFAVDSLRNAVVLSRHTAGALGLSVGDRLFAAYVVDGRIVMRRVKVAAIYESGFGDFDRTVVYTSMAALRDAASSDDQSATSVEIYGLRGDSIADLAAQLQTSLLDDYNNSLLAQLYPVDNVTHTGAMYYNWLSLLDTNVAVIFILMLCVSAFTLISSLFIIILERIQTIGILRALGATRSTVRMVFVHMAMRVAGLGVLVGNAIALPLLWIQHATGIIPLNPEMYFLKSVPVSISPLTVVLLDLGALAIAWLVLVLPSQMASRIDPARVMHYE